MASRALRNEERVGLVLAVALHAALVGVLLWRPAVAPLPVPQRISVTLSPDIAPQATAPTHEDAAADMAPKLGSPPPSPAAPVEAEPVVTPPPAKIIAPPVEQPVPEPKPVTITRPRPKPAAMAKPKPSAVTPPEPVPAPAPPAKVIPPRHQKAKPRETPIEATPVARAAKATAKHTPSVKDWSLDMPATADHAPPGASRIGNDFLKGVSGGKASGKAQQQGAAVIGPEVKSAMAGAIAHQLKPHWLAPQGADADRLVTILSWDLNRDGSLAGPPRVVRQEGITDSNRPQAARHAEQAIRAVQLGAPFKLPPEYYDTWKHVRSFEFNRTLSQ